MSKVRVKPSMLRESIWQRAAAYEVQPPHFINLLVFPKDTAKSNFDRV